MLTLALPPLKLMPDEGANFGRGFQVIVPLPRLGRVPLGTGAHAVVVVVVGAAVVVVAPATVVVVVDVVVEVDVVVDVVDEVDVVVVEVVVVVGVSEVSGLEKCPVRSLAPPEVVHASPCDGVTLPRNVTAPLAPKMTTPCTLHVAVPATVTLDGPWFPRPWSEPLPLPLPSWPWAIATPPPRATTSPSDNVMDAVVTEIFFISSSTVTVATPESVPATLPSPSQISSSLMKSS